MDTDLAKDVDAAIGVATSAKATRVRVLLAQGEPVTVALAARGRRQLGLRRVLASEDWIGLDCLTPDGLDVVDRYRRAVEVVEVREDKPILEDPGTPPLPDNKDAQLVAAMVHAQRAVLAPFVAMVESVVKGYGSLLDTLQRKADGAEERESQRLDLERAQLDADRAQIEADRSEIERAAAEDEGLAATLAPVVQALPALLAGRGGNQAPPTAAGGVG